MPIRRVSMYYCQTKSPDQVEQAVAQIERYLASRAGNPDAFSVASQEALLDAVRQVTSTMTLLLGTIAGISLVVGGIGIMNTLLTSVAERTREDRRKEIALGHETAIYSFSSWWRLLR